MRAQELYMSPATSRNINPKNGEQDRPSYPLSQGAQRRILASSASKPRNPYVSKVEGTQAQDKLVATLSEDDMRRMFVSELTNHFEVLRSELVDEFSSMIRSHKNAGRLGNEEIKEIKQQIAHNRDKFEEIQNHIARVNQQFADINSLYTEEFEVIKNQVGLESKRRADGSATVEVAQKQLEAKFNILRQDLINEIQNSAKNQTKPKLNEAIVNDLKQVKLSFEEDLKNNFDTINNRVKNAEENLNAIMKKKADHMESIRDEFLASLETLGAEMTEEVGNLERALLARDSANQARENYDDEIERRIEPFREEIEKIKHTIFSCQDEIERVTSQTQRNFEDLDYNVREKFAELQQVSPRKSTGQLEQRVARLDQESENYYNEIQELRQSLKEIQEVYKILQNEPKFNKTDDIAVRLEAKINNLQAQIQSLSAQPERQTARPPLTDIRNLPTTPENVLKKAPLRYTNGASVTNANVTQVSTNSLGYQKPELYQTGVRDEPAFSVPKSQERSVSPYRFEAAPVANTNYAPFSYSTGNISNIMRPEEEKPKMSVSLHEGRSTPIQENGLPPKKDTKYYGDPKVKSIIDEFNMKKRQQTQSGVDNYDRSSRLGTDSSLPPRISIFSPSPTQPPVTLYPPDYFVSRKLEPEINKSMQKEPVITNTLSSYPVYNYAASPAPKWDPYRDINISNVHKSAAPSNLSMTYSTANPKVDSSPKTEEFSSPQSRHKEIEEDIRPAIKIQPPIETMANLKKGPEHGLLSSQLLNSQQQPAPLPQVQSISVPAQRDSRRSVGGGSLSGVDTDQFQDANEYMSDFDVSRQTKEEFKSFASPGRVNTNSSQLNFSSNKKGKLSKIGGESNVKSPGGEQQSKKLKHEKILAQIDFFIHGKISNVLNEDDDEEIFCNLDDDGYIFDEDGDYVLDKAGVRVKLSPEEIDRFNNNNMIE